MIMALTVSTLAVSSLLEGAMCAIAVYTTGKKPSKVLLK